MYRKQKLDEYVCRKLGLQTAEPDMGAWEQIVERIKRLLPHPEGVPRALAIPAQVHALVGIAAAPDFTDWGTSAEQQAELAAGRALEVLDIVGDALLELDEGAVDHDDFRRHLYEVALGQSALRRESLQLHDRPGGGLG